MFALGPTLPSRLLIFVVQGVHPLLRSPEKRELARVFDAGAKGEMARFPYGRCAFSLSLKLIKI